MSSSSVWVHDIRVAIKFGLKVRGGVFHGRQVLIIVVVVMLLNIIMSTDPSMFCMFLGCQYPLVNCYCTFASV